MAAKRITRKSLSLTPDIAIPQGLINTFYIKYWNAGKGNPNTVKYRLYSFCEDRVSKMSTNFPFSAKNGTAPAIQNSRTHVLSIQVRAGFAQFPEKRKP
jgi:hypothetical protein